MNESEEHQDRLAHTVNIMELRVGTVVHETQYFADRFEAPAARARLAQRLALRS